MLWFSFMNHRGNKIFVYLPSYDVCYVPHLANFELLPANHAGDERYTVTGKDAERLLRIMEREADKSTPVNFGTEVRA